MATSWECTEGEMSYHGICRITDGEFVFEEVAKGHKVFEDGRTTIREPLRRKSVLHQKIAEQFHSKVKETPSAVSTKSLMETFFNFFSFCVIIFFKKIAIN